MTVPFFASAPFLADFGIDCVAGEVLFRGILDAPGRDLGLGGISVIATDWSLTYAMADVMLSPGDSIAANEQNFKVREVMPLDDGVFARAMLQVRNG